MSHETMECTNPDCHRQTSMFLCTDCIITLDGLLKLVPTLIIMLTGPINRTSVTRNPGGSSGGGGNSTGSKPPINLEALDLRAWLQQLPVSAYTEALTSPTAGRTLVMAGIWVANAETLVYGPPEEIVDEAEIKRRLEKARGELLPPQEVIEYVRKETKITVKMGDFKNWVKLKRLPYVLERVPTDNKTQRLYYPGDLFKVAQQMRARRIKT